MTDSGCDRNRRDADRVVTVLGRVFRDRDDTVRAVLRGLAGTVGFRIVCRVPMDNPINSLYELHR